MKNLIFKELNLSHEVQKALTDMGFEEATPIQSQSIPPILNGTDVIGQAQTGTGKTCAFGIPAIEMVVPGIMGIQVLILCPTRELAIQTAEELTSVAKYKRGLKIVPIYGGQPIERQFTALKSNPQIIIGTPGRVMDHLRRRTLKLFNLKMVVLDEADEMLNMGFREDIDIILEQVPPEKQLILFSATMPQGILDLATRYQKKPLHIKAVQQELTVPQIQQYYLEVRESAKPEILSRLIDAHQLKLSLVFCNTKKRVDELAANLQARGYTAEALHGDMRQTQRDQVMAKFRQGKIAVLIATDVAARGIDVDDIEAVINYDIPCDQEYYVHRVGRTGRAGRTGKAFTLVAGREIYKIKEIQRYTKSMIVAQTPPSLQEVEETKIKHSLNGLKEIIADGQLAKYKAIIEKLLEDPDFLSEQGNMVTPLDVAAAFLKMTAGVNEEPQHQKSPWEFSDKPFADISSPENPGAKKGMVKLFINVGRNNQIQPRHIIQGISAHTGLPVKAIGSINIHDRFTFAEVPHEYATEVLTSMRNCELNGRRINVERAMAR
jgi:ATP-dependent RNA helicase DeaD